MFVAGEYAGHLAVVTVQVLHGPVDGVPIDGGPGVLPPYARRLDRHRVVDDVRLEGALLPSRLPRVGELCEMGGPAVPLPVDPAGEVKEPGIAVPPEQPVDA